MSLSPNTSAPMLRKPNALLVFCRYIGLHRPYIGSIFDVPYIVHRLHRGSIDPMDVMYPIDGVAAVKKGTGKGQTQVPPRARTNGYGSNARSVRRDRRMARSFGFSAVLGYANGYISAHNSENAFPFNAADRFCNPVRSMRYMPC